MYRRASPEDRINFPAVVSGHSAGRPRRERRRETKIDGERERERVTRCKFCTNAPDNNTVHVSFRRRYKVVRVGIVRYKIVIVVRRVRYGNIYLLTRRAFCFPSRVYTSALIEYGRNCFRQNPMLRVIILASSGTTTKKKKTNRNSTTNRSIRVAGIVDLQRKCR